MSPFGRVTWLLLCAALAGPLAAACSPAPTQDGVQRDIPFCNPDGVALKMDLYSPRVATTAPMPAVLYVHGGGWRTGDKSEIAWMRTVVRDLGPRGFRLASVNYRLAPEYRWPAPIEDVRCALRFLRANAATYHIDPARIAAWGQSAGGQLVDLLALNGEAAPTAADADAHLKAVVDVFGPTDLPAVASTPWGTSVFPQVFGTDPGVLVRASPVTHVFSGAPPFLIFHGDADDVVPLSQSQELYERLKSAGVDATLVVVRHSGHDFQPQGGALDPSVDAIRAMILDFLRRKLAG